MTAERPWRGDPAEIVAALTTDRRELLRQLIPPPPAWHAEAACRGHDPAAWFPSAGQSIKFAVEICNICPVRRECLDEALADPDLDVGIRGGLSATARIAHRRADPSRSRRARRC